jgi:peptidoglycan/LPS O-acetylase OafA/YrhL
VNSLSDVKPSKENEAKFDNTLEAARGIAVVVVMFSHSLGSLAHPSAPDPLFGPISVINLLFVGHAAVLFFLILSGYVIGINHQSDYVPGAANIFYKKRLLRLLPIYVIAIAFSVLVSGGADNSATTISGPSDKG